MKNRLSTLFQTALLAGLLCSCRTAGVEGQKVQAEFSPRGLASLQWSGTDVLKEGRPAVRGVILERRALDEEGIYEYDFEEVDGKDPQVAFDEQDNILTYTYSWGTVAFEYTIESDRLNVAATINNKSDRSIAMFDITPLRLSLPDKVDAPKQGGSSATMPGDLGVLQANSGERKLLWCAETVLPLHIGFGKLADKQKTLPLTLRGGVHMLEPGGVVYHHHGLPRIEPGKSLVIRASLRFADAEAETDELVSDVVEAFREYHQPRMVWEDRRPVGAIFIGKGRGPANNPRNWFGDKNLDVRTEDGVRELRRRMMEHADNCIKVLEDVNAQGMVLWDPEGGENPHPVTYIGDPRMMRLVAPEMVDIYPDYFQRFRDAGFRTGLCIRPSQVYMTPFTNACDGDPDSRWSVQKFPQWLEVDFGEERMVDRTEVVCLNDRAYQFKVEAKTADDEYKLLVDRTDNETPGKADAPITDEFEPVRARRVRLTVTGAHDYEGDWCSIREFRVFAGQSANLCLNNAADTSRRFGRTVGGHVYHYDSERNPLNDDFDGIRPEGVPDKRFFPIVERMSRKIEFAKRNWGCTLFYIDTNGVQRPVGEEQKVKWTLLDNHIWRELHKRHPDVLLIPEFAPNPGQLAYTSLYLQPPHSPPVLKRAWRDLLPGAFGVSYTVNLKVEDWNELRPRLIEGIEAGDAMFFRGWFGDRYNTMIKDLYDEVYNEGAINPGLPASYLAPDPGQ